MEFAHSATEIKVLFDVLKDIVSDCNLVFSHEGLSIVALDPEKVAAVAVHLRSPAFYEFKEDPSKALFIGVNMQHLYRLVRGVQAVHSVRMEINPETPNVLKLVIYHPTNGIVSTTSLYSLDLPKEQPSLPTLTFDAVARIPTTDFMRSIKDLSHGAKKLTVSFAQAEVADHPTHLTFAAKGTNYSYTTSIAVCPAETGLVWVYNNLHSLRASYLIKYIEKFAKPQFGKSMSISFDKDGAMNLAYEGLAIGEMNMTVCPILEESE